GRFAARGLGSSRRSWPRLERSLVAAGGRSGAAPISLVSRPGKGRLATDRCRAEGKWRLASIAPHGWRGDDERNLTSRKEQDPQRRMSRSQRRPPSITSARLAASAKPSRSACQGSSANAPPPPPPPRAPATAPQRAPA